MKTNSKALIIPINNTYSLYALILSQLNTTNTNQILTTIALNHLFKNHPFKNNNQTQTQILTKIIYIKNTHKIEAKPLTHSGLNMIINRLQKQEVLTYFNGFYTLNQALNELETVNQIVFRLNQPNPIKEPINA
jgi:hypothetical protein